MKPAAVHDCLDATSGGSSAKALQLGSAELLLAPAVMLKCLLRLFAHCLLSLLVQSIARKRSPWLPLSEGGYPRPVLQDTDISLSLLC